MAITSADVLLIAPELSTLSAGQWTAIIADVEDEIDDAAWGTTTRADKAKKYLAAHKGTLAKRAGAAGSVQSIAVGGVSVNYGSGAQMGTGLDSTSYGVEYKRLCHLYFNFVISG